MKTKIETEIEIPEGYEFVRFYRVGLGQSYIELDGTIGKWAGTHLSVGQYVIIKPTQTLKVRIEAEYGDYDVVMLDFNGSILRFWHGYANGHHAFAQSVKGFHEYVYHRADDTFLTTRNPTEYTNKTIQPVSVLFYKEEK